MIHKGNRRAGTVIWNSNNRKSTKGRKRQFIEMENGKTIMIQHVIYN
jgi:hypothetical protein